jgi:hypothetical protein
MASCFQYKNKVLLTFICQLSPKSCCISIVAAINAKLKEFAKIKIFFAFVDFSAQQCFEGVEN